MTGPRVKGVAFLSVLSVVEKLAGADKREAVASGLSREARDAIQYGRLIKGGWYPIEWYKELLGLVRTVTGEGPLFMRRVGAEALRADLTGVFSFLVKLVSPAMALSGSARTFSSYYDTGKVTITESRKGYAVAEWTGCVGFDQNMWQELVGSAESLLEMSGAKSVRVRVSEGGRNDDDNLRMVAHWS